MGNCSSGLQSPAVFGFQREDSGTVLLKPQHSIHVNDDENGNLSVKILNVLYPSKAKLSTPFEICLCLQQPFQAHLHSQRCSLLSLSHSSYAERNEKDISLTYSVRMTIPLLLLENQLSKEDPEEKDPCPDWSRAVGLLSADCELAAPHTARLLCINT